MAIRRHNFPSEPKKISEAVRNCAEPATMPVLRMNPGLRQTLPNDRDRQKAIKSDVAGLPDSSISQVCKKTFSENLLGLLIEAVIDPSCPHRLTLCTYAAGSAELRSSVQHKRIVYSPGSVGPGLAQAVRFPTMRRALGSGGDLVSEIKKFFAKHIDQDAQTINILVAFVFASWFIDSFQVAPVLYLHGPDTEVSLVLRLLNTVCYHPVLISELDVAALRLLPAELRVTLLINETDLLPRVQKALSASTRRDFYLATGNRLMDIFGARALHCDWLSGEVGLNLCINPARCGLESLTEIEERELAEDFQSKLLAYRVGNHAHVKQFKVEPEAIYPGLEDEMKTWLAALPAGLELKNSVLLAFAESHENLSAARFEDPKCLVAEAALMFCHRKGAEHFYVRELAEKVNDLLVGRHTDSKVEDRKVGSVLDQLGIHKRRVTKGYRVKLTPATRERIHRVASAYSVLSVSTDRCADCKNQGFTRTNDQ